MAQRWLVATALLVALSGCGDDAGTKPATVPAPATSSEAPAPSAPAVAAGRTGAAPTATGTPRSSPRSGQRSGQRGGHLGGHRAAKPRTVAMGTSGFVAAVQKRLPEVAVDHRDEEIADIAGQACTSLAAGEGAGTIVAGTERFGTDEATAHKLIKMAIDNVCPDQDRRIEEF